MTKEQEQMLEEVRKRVFNKLKTDGLNLTEVELQRLTLNELKKVKEEMLEKQQNQTKHSQTVNLDSEYLTDFHREWNERCMKENEAMKSRHFTHEYLKAQSQRMKELVRLQEEELRKQRKHSSSDGQKQQKNGTAE